MRKGSQRLISADHLQADVQGSTGEGTPILAEWSARKGDSHGYVVKIELHESRLRVAYRIA